MQLFLFTPRQNPTIVSSAWFIFSYSHTSLKSPTPIAFMSFANLDMGVYLRACVVLLYDPYYHFALCTQ